MVIRRKAPLIRRKAPLIRRKALFICSPQLGLAPKSVLGGEVFDRQILLGLAKRGVKIEIILPEGIPHDQKIKNWKVTYLPISHFPAILGNLLIIPYLYKIYSRRKFDVLRIHQPQFLGPGCLLFKIHNQQIKLVATYHQFRESNFWIFSKIINSFWDHIICDSQNVKNRLIRTYHVPASRISVVHNGVPPYLKPAKKDPQLVGKLNLQNKIVLLFMGLLDKRKNPLFLLDVLKILKTDNVVLIFWGNGPLESQIKARAQELGIKDKIRIQKPVFGKDKNKIHNLADIFVHPSLDEGFSLAPLEAMACAKPVVMTYGYSAEEAVDDGINGYLCSLNDKNHWSEKLTQLIMDQELRVRMGKASLAKVKAQFQWSYAVEKHVQVFKKLLSHVY